MNNIFLKISDLFNLVQPIQCMGGAVVQNLKVLAEKWKNTERVVQPLGSSEDMSYCRTKKERLRD